MVPQERYLPPWRGGGDSDTLEPPQQQQPTAPWVDPSEPIYTDPSLFERYEGKYEPVMSVRIRIMGRNLESDTKNPKFEKYLKKKSCHSNSLYSYSQLS